MIHTAVNSSYLECSQPLTSCEDSNVLPVGFQASKVQFLIAIPGSPCAPHLRFPLISTEPMRSGVSLSFPPSFSFSPSLPLFIPLSKAMLLSHYDGQWKFLFLSGKVTCPPRECCLNSIVLTRQGQNLEYITQKVGLFQFGWYHVWALKSSLSPNYQNTFLLLCKGVA